MSLVSIIVPIYNCANDLGKSVQSILAQSYTKLQIILVDDGSTDGSGAICDDFAAVDNRVIVIHKENGGVSSARNVGLDKCSGEYVLFVDSDDYLYPDAVKTLVTTADEKSVDLVLFGFCYNNVTNGTRWDNLPGSEFFGKTADFMQTVCGDLIAREFFNPPWNKLIRRNLLEDNGIRFNERISICEDMALSMQLLEYSSNIAVLDKVLYDYCIKESGSLVFKYNKNFLEAIEYYYLCAKNCTEKYEHCEAAVLAIQRICLNRVYVHCLKLFGSQKLDKKVIAQERNVLFSSSIIKECIKDAGVVKKLFFAAMELRLYFLNHLWAKSKGY